MKKIKLLILALLFLSVVSCKKDRTCTCDVFTPTGTYITKVEYFDIKKKDARPLCIGTQTTVTTANSTTVSNKITCKLS